uniref:Interferon induced with helicase C domain 1 n=1 Tax=Eptatretus burgeri TaxID=7764 RepID=A0A8C4QRT8_EPTBU
MEEKIFEDYQVEVAQPALQGENIIICLPTGTGKTRVAAFIIQRHLSAATMEKKKVVVLVNKVALVEQHYREFHNFLKPHFKVTRVSGEAHHKGNFGIGLQDNDVIVCTAQIMENALCGELFCADFSLLIFDECHHTTKENIYNKIMEKHLPQIVGLTASPGVGGAKDVYKAQSHILKQRKIFCLWYCKYKSGCSMNCLCFQDRFGGILKEMMTEIHHNITEDVKHKFGTQSYEQWIVTLEKIGMYFQRVCAVHLRKYNDALLINQKLRMKDALNILLDFYDEEDFKYGNRVDEDTDDELEKVASDPLFENSCLNELQQAIMENFVKNSSSQGIVFTQTRKGAFALREWIGQNKILQSHKVKAHHLVGSGNGKNYKQMTSSQSQHQNEQKEVIDKFRNGTFNLLISTTVAEEGLDIKACNFVICYRMVTNEIAMVQKRGRARANDSSYILVACEDEDVSVRESTNRYRENMMAKAIKQVQGLRHEDYLKQLTLTLMRKTNPKKIAKFKKQPFVPPDDVVFLCRNCNHKSCHGSDIRVPLPSLQALNKIRSWSNTWNMPFNPDKSHTHYLYLSISLKGQSGNPLPSHIPPPLLS